MRKTELSRALNRLISARDASNWQGKFDNHIRSATKNYRHKEITEPLNEAIAMLQKELDRVVKKRNHRQATFTERLPYKDN